MRAYEGTVASSCLSISMDRMLEIPGGSVTCSIRDVNVIVTGNDLVNYLDK